MGNIFTVRNDIGEEVLCEVYPVGLKRAMKAKLIPASTTSTFKFGICHKTFIVSIQGKAVRAMSKIKKACLKQISSGEYIITVEDLGTGISVSSKDILECYEMDVNWNVVRDAKVKENLGLMMALNKHISSVLGMACGFVVAEGCGNKDAARLATKMSTDFFTSYLKISLPQLKLKEDSEVIIKINEIYLTLVALSRNVSAEFPYFKQSIGEDNKLSIIQLHKLLSKITMTNMFPFLEQCGLEIAVLIYIFGINLVIDIMDRISEFSSNGKTEVEKTFLEVFINNLKEMWNSVLENIEPNCKIKVRGFLLKNAVLTYNGDLIYRVKSINNNVAKSRIENIKQEFIRNRIYQLEFLCNHPKDFMRKFEEKNYN